MCGRYAAAADQAELIETYDIDLITDEAAAELSVPRYNIAPTDRVLSIIERSAEQRRELLGMRWGLVPSWSRKPPSRPLINARVETVAEKPSFRSAFAKRRCLLPATGYYEWRQQGGARQPFFIRSSDLTTMAFAGIYEFWRAETGWLVSTAMITNQATDESGWLHDRMPMVVTDPQAWLADDTSINEAQSLLESPSQLTIYPVSTAVGKVANDWPELIEPIGRE